MIVRELVTMFGVRPDAASFRKAETMTGNLMKAAKGLITTFGGLFAAYKVAGFFRDMVGNASDANETLNVLDASFREQQQGVMDWAKTFGDAAGRSEYAMREMAGTFGAVLNPMMENNAEVTAELSKSLGQLTVDLGSFYNAAEPDVLIALRSGITGEAEPLKRFGIVMNEAALKAFALKEGIKGDIKAMSIAEKTLLRYKFIMAATVNAQGDAIKTSAGWANATKALQAKLRDMSTRIGLMLMPSLEKMIKGVIKLTDKLEPLATAVGNTIKSIIDFVEWLSKLWKNMSPTTKKILLAVAALKNFRRIIRFILSPFGKWMLLIGAVILLLDDFQFWLNKGGSALGRVLKKLKEWTGIDFDKKLREFIDALNILAADPEPFDWVAYWEEVKNVMLDYLTAAAAEYKNWWDGIIADSTDKSGELNNAMSEMSWFDSFMASLPQSLSESDSMINNFFGKIKDGFWGVLAESDKIIEEFIFKTGPRIIEAFGGTINEMMRILVPIMTTAVREIGNAIIGLGPALIEIFKFVIKEVGGAIYTLIDLLRETIGRVLEKLLMKLGTTVLWLRNKLLGEGPLYPGASGKPEEETPENTTPKKQTQKTIAPIEKIISGIKQSFAPGFENPEAMAKQISGLQQIMSSQSPIAVPLASSSSTTNNQNVKITNSPNVKVEVHPAAGMDEEEIGRSVAKHVSAEYDRANREAALAFRNKTAPGLF